MTWSGLTPTLPEPHSKPRSVAQSVWAVPVSAGGTPGPGQGQEHPRSPGPIDALRKVWRWFHRPRPPQVLRMTVREFLAIFDRGSQDERFIDRADGDEYTSLVRLLVQRDRKDDPGSGPAA